MRPITTLEKEDYFCDLSFSSSDELLHNLLNFSPLQRALNILGHQFKDSGLLLEAVCHSSFIHEKQRLNLKDNERLEHLGDSFLGASVTAYLFDRYADFSEGDLSKFRSFLVSEKSLKRYTEFLGLGQCLLVGKGEKRHLKEKQGAFAANAFEALLGAIYLDSVEGHPGRGFQVCFEVTCRLFSAFEEQVDADYFNFTESSVLDAKSKLQEFTMKKFHSLPDYRVKESVRNKQDYYEVELYIQGQFIGVTDGPSKKEAMKKLAEEALGKDLSASLT